MKKRLLAILMAAALAVPTTVFAEENPASAYHQTAESVSEQSTETAEEEDTKASSGQDMEAAEEQNTEAAAKQSEDTASEETKDPSAEKDSETAGQKDTEAAAEQSTEAAAEQSAETDAKQETKSDSEKEPETEESTEEDNGPRDLTGALPEYSDMKWDSKKGCYLHKVGDTVIRIDPEDPEFDRYVFGTGEKDSVGNGTGINQFNTARIASGNVAYSPYTKANYTFSTAYSGYTVLDGIDVSYHNGVINWATVKASGIDFAIIRVGYRGSSDGLTKVDPNYAANLNGAIAAGIKVGVYYFSQAITEAEAVDEAQRAIAAVSGYSLSLPIFIDYEFYGNGRLKAANLTPDKHQSICNAFCTTVKNAGHTPGIYANRDMLTNSMRPNNSISGTKYWMAQYQTTTNYAGSYEIWQYSSRGSVAGVGSTNCDVNFMFQKTITASITASPRKLKLEYGGSASSTLTAQTSLNNASYSWSLGTATDMNGSSINASKIASLSGTSGGSVTLNAKTPGKVKVNLTASSGSQSATASITIIIRGVIDNAYLSTTEFPYIGKARTPTPTVYYGDTQLKKTTHFTVTYTGNKGVGTAQAIVMGTGLFTGRKVLPFTITPTDLSTAKLDITKIAAQTYSPKGISPSTTIMYRTSKLSPVKHYSLSYEGPSGTTDVITEPGDYTLVVNALEGSVFTGSQTTDVSFTVKPRKLAASMFRLSDTVINAGAEAPSVYGAYSTASLEEGTDYTLTESSYSGSKGTYTIIAEGTGNYTGKVKLQFKAVSAKTKLISTSSCEITLANDAYTYNGKAKKPGVTVVYGSKTLKKDRDYTVSYKRSNCAGTAFAVVTGAGAYSGSVSVPYTIAEGDESVATVTLSKKAFTFSGKVCRPGVTVKVGSKTLKRNSDYRLIYGNPNSRDAGSYDVTVELRGNQTGSISATYRIKPVNLSQVAISVPAQTYTGEAVEPATEEMTFKLGDVYLTPADIDMISIDSYSNNVKASNEAKVTFSGDGNFTGSRTKTFTIKK